MAKKDNVFVKAKAYQRNHPRTAWQDCIKAVSGKRKKRKVGSVAKKKKYRQTGSSNRKADRERSARKPGPRIPAGGDHVTYHERRKNRSDVPGMLTGLTTGQLLAAARKKLVVQEDNMVLRKYHATGKRVKKKIQKGIIEVRRKIRKLL